MISAISMMYPLFEITDKANYTGRHSDSQQPITGGEESLQVFISSTLPARATDLPQKVFQ
ncbi:hypothetical protein JCM39068_19660 [Desulfocastanea catecholica]